MKLISALYSRLDIVSLTVATRANNAVQDGDEVGDDTIDLVEASQDCDHIRTGVGVLLAQNASQEDR